MAKYLGNKSACLLRSVQKRALSIKEAEEEKLRREQDLVPYIPKDCLSNILVRLPLDSLQRSRFVCKTWFDMINNPVFIDTHLNRSETVLIFLRSERVIHPFSMTSLSQEKPNTYSVEQNILHNKSNSIFRESPVDFLLKFYIQFLEIKEGKSKIGEFNISCLGGIRATCNGLILLENKLKKGGVMVMNPVTRELILLPLGTLYPAHKESYGFAFSLLTRLFKVVHLFKDEMGYVGCEILNLGENMWREVDGPSFGLFQWFGAKPIWAIGALHWIPQIDYSDYIVYMELETEKFGTIQLPKSSRIHDGIVKLEKCLSFVTHTEMNQIEVWTLKDLYEEWMKLHIISVGCIPDMVPLFGSRNGGEIIFKRYEDGSLYSYDFYLQVMKSVEMEKKYSSSYLPHVNSLISWRNCHVTSSQKAN